MTLTSCRLDPARALVPVLARLPAAGVPLGDVLADSGYAHRTAEGWAIPLRPGGAALICDLHPDDRGPHGTHHGAIISNGTLYCPATPRPLLELGPLARDATPDQTAAHDQQTTETARCKLGKITAEDADGYHRVMCPAAAGKGARSHPPLFLPAQAPPRQSRVPSSGQTRPPGTSQPPGTAKRKIIHGQDAHHSPGGHECQR
jgi:hypothetical protein